MQQGSAGRDYKKIEVESFLFLFFVWIWEAEIP